MMGCYFNPPDEVCNVGRSLAAPTAATSVKETFDSLNAQLNEDEVLVGLFQRLDFGFKNCPWLKDEHEMVSFLTQVADGIIVLEGYFALPRKKMPGANK